MILLILLAAANGMGADMRMAETTAEMAKTMENATIGMAKSANSVKLEQLSANRTKMDGLKRKMGAAHDLLTQGEGDIEIGAGAEDLLATLEAENNEFAMVQISDIPQGVPVQAAGPAKGLSLK